MSYRVCFTLLLRVPETDVLKLEDFSGVAVRKIPDRSGYTLTCLSANWVTAHILRDHLLYLMEQALEFGGAWEYLEIGEDYQDVTHTSKASTPAVSLNKLTLERKIVIN